MSHTHHMSHISCVMSHVTYHMLPSHVTYHMLPSHVTYHMSHITCYHHMSHLSAPVLTSRVESERERERERERCRERERAVGMKRGHNHRRKVHTHFFFLFFFFFCFLFMEKQWRAPLLTTVAFSTVPLASTDSSFFSIRLSTLPSDSPPRFPRFMPFSSRILLLHYYVIYRSVISSVKGMLREGDQSARDCVKNAAEF